MMITKSQGRSLHARGVAGRLRFARSVAAVTFFAGSVPATAETIEIYSSGSQRPILAPTIAKEAGLPEGTDLKLTFGAGGNLRERLEKGEHADLFLSADMKAPRTLVENGHALIGPIAFARNHMCLISRKSLDVTPKNIVDRMLDPATKLATSTPIADPGGDYAYQIFDRAEAVHPGARKTLSQKALNLLGDPQQAPPEHGHTAAGSLFLRDKADMLILYCSSAPSIVKEIPSLASLILPAELDPGPTSGMAILSTKAAAWRLALFLVSERGQKLVGEAGLVPLLGRTTSGEAAR